MVQPAFVPEGHIPAQTTFFSILPVFNPFLEFRMGIRTTNTTWRSPLQLIDSWLPAPVHRATSQRGLPQLVQRFARAGWLGRNRVTAPTGTVEMGLTTFAATSPRTCLVRVVPTGSGGFRGDARMVISGRMADVCAELDRLAALEQKPAETARI